MTLMTSVRGVHYIRTVTPILGHGSVKVSFFDVNGLSAVAEHFSTTGHIIDWENTKVLDREDREYPRQVREAIYIKKKKPSLNRDQGLELPSLYNGLL